MIATETTTTTSAADDLASVMSDEERFLFDLRGFLVLRGVLDAERIRRMHAAIDQKVVHTVKNDPFQSRFGGFFDWGEDWTSLIDHARILPILRGIIGERFRLDHAYGMTMNASGERGNEGLHHHAGLYDHGCFYATTGTRMHNGLVVVSYTLVDVPPGAGGFCCIPGTHKSMLAPPKRWFGTLDNPLIEHVALKAGDVVVFSEALSHGTMSWTCRDYDRRAVLLKYAPGYMQFSGNPVPVKNVEGLTPRQRLIASPPGSLMNRPEVMSVG
jgi:hypothetical protein